MPMVFCCSVGDPTFVSGNDTPVITGISSPTVAVVSAKNTIETNVSTSGMRFSCTSRNLPNCAERRASRMDRARGDVAILVPPPCPRRRRDLCRSLSAADGDPRELRQLDALEHVHDVFVRHGV